MNYCDFIKIIEYNFEKIINDLCDYINLIGKSPVGSIVVLIINLWEKVLKLIFRMMLQCYIQKGDKE